MLLGWQAIRGRPMPTLKQWRNATLIGFLLLVVGNGGVAVAERWVSSGATVALISIMPLATALWSGAFGQWPRRAEWVAIALGGVGAAVMLLGRDLQASLLGTLIILLGTSAGRWARCSRGAWMFRMDRLDLAPKCWRPDIMALLISALGDHWTLPQAPRVLWAWAYLVVFGSLIAFSAYRFVVERVSPTLASTYAYINPPVALWVGWWLGHETFSPNVLFGLPIVLGSVALHAWIQTRDRAVTAPAPARNFTEPCSASD